MPPELLDKINAGLAGEAVPDVKILSVVEDPDLVFEGEVVYGSIAFIDGMLVLILEDGSVVVLKDLDGRDYAIEPVADNLSRKQIVILEDDGNATSIGQGSSGEELAVSNLDPLFGLPINLLLPPTDYPIIPQRDRDFAADNGAFSDVSIVELSPTTSAETDAPVSLRLADFVRITTNTEGGEDIDTVTLTITDLPAGTTSTAGTLSAASDGTLTLDFTGDGAAWDALTLTFPADFSSASRSDIASGPMSGTISVLTTLDGTASLDFPVTLLAEADIALDGPGSLALAETDAPLDFRPADALLPRASDIDGSESITQVTLSLPDLPPGTLYSTDNGASFRAAGTEFTLTLAEYQAMIIRLPADFSTQNPPSSLSGLLTATTNEGGFIEGPINISVTFELDVDLSAPAVITGTEDSNGVDGSGVTVDLGIAVAATDQDGSEDGTTVEIAFTGLPPGALVNGGTLDPATGIWTGSMAEANALGVFLPGDFSGSVTAVI
ncbi:hypothetical protein ATO3_13725, partial [Marinibacterium profundimaris]